MKAKESDDLRPDDIKKLSESGCERDFVLAWENILHNETSKSGDENQNHWHLARMSFLLGYLCAEERFKAKQ